MISFNKNITEVFIWKFLKKKRYHSKRWITRLMGRWRTQQTVRHRVNCRTHEHRHFERISQSMLYGTLINFEVLLGLHMVEGCKTMQNKLLISHIFLWEKHMLYYWLRFFFSFVKEEKKIYVFIILRNKIEKPHWKNF